MSGAGGVGDMCEIGGVGAVLGAEGVKGMFGTAVLRLKSLLEPVVELEE